MLELKFTLSYIIYLLFFKDERVQSKRSSNWLKVLLKAVGGNGTK